VALSVNVGHQSSISNSSRVFLDLSCTNCKDLGLMLMSLIHFELILVQGDRHGSSFSFLQADNHFSQQHLLKSKRSCVYSYLGPLFFTYSLKFLFPPLPAVVSSDRLTCSQSCSLSHYICICVYIYILCINICIYIYLYT
jgi:hypothetical protein